MRFKVLFGASFLVSVIVAEGSLALAYIFFGPPLLSWIATPPGSYFSNWVTMAALFVGFTWLILGPIIVWIGGGLLWVWMRPEKVEVPKGFVGVKVVADPEKIEAMSAEEQAKQRFEERSGTFLLVSLGFLALACCGPFAIMTLNLPSNAVNFAQTAATCLVCVSLPLALLFGAVADGFLRS